MLLREIKEDLENWKNIPCIWIGKLNLRKIMILPELM